jgi:hypothetical protein
LQRRKHIVKSKIAMARYLKNFLVNGDLQLLQFVV